MALGGHASKIVTVNIDILTVNIVICHCNPHKSYKLFDIGMFMAVRFVSKWLLMTN